MHSALKHGGYSATGLLPGENRAAFEKLHRDLINEFSPDGISEHQIVENMARYIWRMQNLETFRAAKRAWDRYYAIQSEYFVEPELGLLNVPQVQMDPEQRAELRRIVQDRAQKELGGYYELTQVGRAATFDGLEEELAIEERLQAMFEKCVKQFLHVKGVKSVISACRTAAPLITGPRKAA
jgi:hypothetical protein